MLMLSSYEYLGLLGHPHLQETAIAALEQYGTGHHGARLLVGTTTVHKRLEAKLAHFMDAQDAIVFSSGYVANLATISALVGPGDCIIGDQLNHASIMDGCRMSGADFWEFKHNDPDSLAELLQQTERSQNVGDCRCRVQHGRRHYQSARGGCFVQATQCVVDGRRSAQPRCAGP